LPPNFKIYFVQIFTKSCLKNRSPLRIFDKKKEFYVEQTMELEDEALTGPLLHATNKSIKKSPKAI
jgi:hypothetical protein